MDAPGREPASGAAPLLGLPEDEPPLVSSRPPGPRSRAASARLADVECPAFFERRKARAEARGEEDAGGIVLARGRGANVFDVDDNRYVDLAAGFGAALLGHGPSPAHAAAHAQIDRLVQGLGDLYASDVKVDLVERVRRLHPDPRARVLLCQSGADAVTAALKTAVLATGRAGILAFEGGYHGLGHAPLAACGFRESFRAPFAAQLNPHVTFAPFPRASEELGPALEASERALAGGGVGAVLVEPLLGRGGVIVPPTGFVAALGELARRHGALLVADEIWTGLGRGGAWLRSVADGASPDVVVLGKGLGASFPISACVASEAAMGAWARGGEVVHTSTHAGAPLGCAAALATLDAIERGDLVARADRVGAGLRAALGARLGAHPTFRAVRGAGLVIGVELASGALGLAAHQGLLERGWLCTVGGRTAEVLVFTPPLTIDAAVLGGVVDALAETLDAVQA